MGCDPPIRGLRHVCQPPIGCPRTVGTVRPCQRAAHRELGMDSDQAGRRRMGRAEPKPRPCQSPDRVKRAIGDSETEFGMDSLAGRQSGDQAVTISRRGGIVCFARRNLRRQLGLDDIDDVNLDGTARLGFPLTVLPPTQFLHFANFC